MNRVSKEVLRNGLMVVTEAMPAVRSIAVGIWLRSGSREETKEENGLSHFIEHMVFKGTRSRSAEEIAKAADAIGGHLDAFTSKEFTAFSIKVLDEHLPRAFDILSDLARNPLFRPRDIAKESRVIQEEIRMVEDTPDDLVHEIFTQGFWPGHSLGRPILGTRQTVKSFTRHRVFNFYRRHYAPRNLLITAAGNLEHRRMVDLAVEKFGDLASAPAPPHGSAPVPHPSVFYRRKKELEQAHLCVGTPACAYAEPKKFATLILNAVLGGGMSSRLFQGIREKRALAYAVFSGISSYRDAGMLSVYAGTAAANARKVLDLILEEFRRLKTQPIPKEEFQRAKDYLKGSTLLSLETSGSRMSALARQEIYYGRHVSLDEIAARVDAVTQDEVLAVAREMFQPERIAATILGPREDFRIRRSQIEC
jgi:predicted Zn-dependent peptidase